MNLGNRSDALPAELSGGEKARAAIARALAHSPLIVLADEPTGNLDPAQAAAVLNLLQEINTEGATVIFATHDVSLVESLHVRVIHLEDGKVAHDSLKGQPAKSAHAHHTKEESSSQRTYE
jgi:cell division transport system ATP-binding protein